MLNTPEFVTKQTSQRENLHHDPCKSTPLTPSLIDWYHCQFGSLENRKAHIGELLAQASKSKSPKAKVEAFARVLNTQNVDHSDFIIDDIDRSIKRQGKKSENNSEFEIQTAKNVLQEIGVSETAIQKLETAFGLKEYWIFGNLRKMLKLESQQPGIINTLVEDFGITCFNRDKTDVFIRQYKERFVTGNPYVLITRGQADHNAAFADDDSGTQHIMRQCAKKGIPVRVIEARNKQELAQIYKKLIASYGEHQVGLHIFAAHGNPDSIRLGEESLRTTDLNPVSEIGQLIGSMTKSGSEAVMWACSTGQKFARSLSMTIAGKAIGPHNPSTYQYVKLNISPDKVISVNKAKYGNGFPKDVTDIRDFFPALGKSMLDNLFGAKKNEFVNGNLTISTPIKNLLTKTQLTNREIDMLAESANKSVGGDNAVALGLLSRYVGMAAKENGQRKKVVDLITDIALSAEHYQTRYLAVHTLISSIPYFISGPVVVSGPKTLNNPADGTENLTIRNEVDADSAIMAINGLRRVIGHTLFKNEVERIRKELKDTFETIKKPSELSGKQNVLSAMEELIKTPALWEETSSAPSFTPLALKAETSL